MTRDMLTGYQVMQIRKIIRKQEIKKCKKQNPDIFEKHKEEPEFWDSLADTYVQKLLDSKGDYEPPYSIVSRGNLDGKGYRLELQDEYNEEKFFVDYTGDVGEAEKYTPPSFWDSFDGWTIFLIVMIPVYLIAFFVSLNIDKAAPPLIITGLGLVNLWLLFNS